MENVLSINVKDNVSDLTADYSYREKNAERKDSFVQSHLYNADAAYDRLKLLRKIMREWRESFNTLDKRDIPLKTIEEYERIWAGMRNLELYEAEIVKLGE